MEESFEGRDGCWLCFFGDGCMEKSTVMLYLVDGVSNSVSSNASLIFKIISDDNPFNYRPGLPQCMCGAGQMILLNAPLNSPAVK